jgi:hypothetical protein
MLTRLQINLSQMKSIKYGYRRETWNENVIIIMVFTRSLVERVCKHDRSFISVENYYNCARNDEVMGIDL